VKKEWDQKNGFLISYGSITCFRFNGFDLSLHITAPQKNITKLLQLFGLQKYFLKKTLVHN